MPTPILLGTTTNLALLIILVFINRKTILRHLKPVKGWAWLIMALVFLLGLSLRLSAPMQHIYFDEHYRLNCAKKILVYGEVETCYYSGYETESCWHYPKPLGTVIIFSAAFLFFGLSNITAIYVSILFGSLCIIMAFLLAYSLLKDERSALYAAALFSFYPMLVGFSATAEDYMIALFFGLFSLLCFSIYVKENDQKTLFLSLISLTFAMNTRIEFISLVPAVILMLSFNGGLLERLKDHEFRRAVIFSLPFFLVFTERFLLQLQNIVIPAHPDRIAEFYPQKIAGVMYELSSGIPNEPLTFFWDFLSGFYYPIVFNMIIAAGIYLTLRHKLTFPWVIGTVSLSLIAIYVITAFLPIVLLVFAVSMLFFLVSSGLVHIQDSIRFLKNKASAIIILILISVSFNSFSYTSGNFMENTVSHSYFNDWYNTEHHISEVRVKELIIKDLPEDAYIVTNNYYLFAVTYDIKPVPLHLAFSNGVVEGIIESGGKVFYINSEVFSPDLVNKYIFNNSSYEFAKKYNLETFREYPLGNMTFTLYHVYGVNESYQSGYEPFPFPPWAERMFGFVPEIKHRD